MIENEWPERRAICLRCRQTFADPSIPHASGHELVSLRSQPGRDRLIGHVWGMPVLTTGKLAWPPSWRIVQVVSGLVAVVCLSLGAVGLLGPIASIIGLVALLLTLLGATHDPPEDDPGPGSDHNESRWRRERETALPGQEPPLLLACSSAVIGTVADGPAGASPLSGERGVAFAINLIVDKDEGGRVLTDAATMGFVITTTEGDDIIIPAGRLRLLAHGGRTEHSGETVDEYLLSIDPLRRYDRDSDPLEHESAVETLLRVGDHVALHNIIKRSTQPPPQWLGNWAAGYRGIAPSFFTIEGTPCVEILP